MTEQRKCKQCEQTKPLDRSHFGWNGHCYRGVCIDCFDGKRGALGAPGTKYKPQATVDLLRQHRSEAELSTLRAEKKDLLKKLVLSDRRASFADDIARFQAPPITTRSAKSLGGMREATMVSLCSDWHVEEPVEAEKVNGLNEYNLDIADARIKRLRDGQLWLLDMHRSKFRIDDMVLWLGGDLMTGYIQEELRESNALSPNETCLWLQERISAMVEGLLAHGKIKRLVIPCSYGNHGRTTDKSRIATGAENSFEWLMYQNLACYFRAEKRITFVAPKSQMLYLNVYGKVLRFTHGDAVAYQGGVGGIMISLNKAVGQWDYAQRADLTNIGHWHQDISLPYAVVNGSLIGYGPYSVRIKAKYEEPSQSSYLVDSKRGKCCSTPIWVGERAAA